MWPKEGSAEDKNTEYTNVEQRWGIHKGVARGNTWDKEDMAKNWVKLRTKKTDKHRWGKERGNIWSKKDTGEQNLTNATKGSKTTHNARKTRD